MLPWFPEAGPDGLSCIMSVRNNPMLRTTVSRSAIERDDAYDKLGMLCLEMLTEHVRDEVRRIADLPGQPLSQASSAGLWLYRDLLDATENKARKPLRDAQQRLPAIVMERRYAHHAEPQYNRSLISRQELRAFPLIFGPSSLGL